MVFRVDPPRRGSPCGCRGSPSGPRGPRDYLRFRWLFADTFPDMSSWGCCSAVVLCSLCPYFTLGPFIFLQLFLLEFLTQGVMITLDLHRQFPPAEVVAQHCSVSTFQSALLTLHYDSWFSFECLGNIFNAESSNLLFNNNNNNNLYLDFLSHG